MRRRDLLIGAIAAAAALSTTTAKASPKTEIPINISEQRDEPRGGTWVIAMSAFCLVDGGSKPTRWGLRDFVLDGDSRSLAAGCLRAKVRDALRQHRAVALPAKFSDDWR